MVEHPVYGISLFSGIGGMDLATSMALGPQYRTLVYIEREAYAAATLVARMEESSLDQGLVWDDITTFNGRPWRVVSRMWPTATSQTEGNHTPTAETHTSLAFLDLLEGLDA